jgi:DNA-directed RNA polymerase subunit H
LVKRKRRKPKEGEIQKKILHFLVPEHEIVKDDEVDKILKKLAATKEQLPRIRLYDPAIQHLNAKEGDLIRIHRKDEVEYYRIVVRD